MMVEGGESRAASATLRRIEATLPVSPANCLITRAARADIAALEFATAL
jgi:hypothetical protein